MMNGYFISITNNLLEDKHFEKMGNAVWLYMWLVDKMTEISEGQGIVNNGYPVSLDMVQKNFDTMSERTYHRMIATLRDAGYINTVKARYGLYITINKAKKQFGKKISPATFGGTEALSPADSGVSKKSSPAKSGNAVLPNMAGSPAKYGGSLYKDNNTITNTKLHSVAKATQASEKKSEKKVTKKFTNEHHEAISKLYYEAIKSLQLPVRNHKNLQAKIREMANTKDPEARIRYLTFMRDNYAVLEWEYKPSIGEAMDIYIKEPNIASTFKKAQEEHAKKKPLRFGKGSTK